MTSSGYLGHSIRRIQEEMGLTCAELAAELGVSKSTVYNLRSGRGQFSSATLDQISDSLHLPPAVLLGGDDSAARLCESVILTSESVGRLQGVKREKALYYLRQLMDLLT